ncbi:D-alanyl-D-alanine carboxypeptidase family protein [Kamptonema sp. UHCC 0994]|uniref:M15 family metallopeptidase n=1 Tax=Kamptonema sp. UHCC 0994 TaxID=3031329 RepID=UPI0023BAE10A|nr:D-alanyl-D-alanine carboxypeptidase family protein [Kamptonema sp. UHCC 0994]MDF0556994.1 D-alanyl-D-alanine carboxypeptidase family protein [Kamptonema sp. UHCC 0994]
MDNASLKRKPPKASELAADDIPEAVRDTPDAQHQPHQQEKKWLIWRLAGLGAIALAASLWLQMRYNLIPGISPSAQSEQNTAALANSPSTAPTSPALPSAQTSPAASETPVASTTPDNLLGHLPYEEAPAAELQPITPDGSLKLRKAAAAKYQEMANAAAAEGIYFAPISGFRSVDDQQHVFFDIKAERGQAPSKRAEVSAPPGYSEHHTGYAIDIGDGSAPETNLSQNFENTIAFKWLQANAAYFSFEMSFPKNNFQGVSYEPWHWRYVGDRNSLETFYKAHSLKGR